MDKYALTISEVSEKYNITQDTLRYYERIGMIPPVTRTKGGIRDYQDYDIEWVKLANCMRSAGLPVEVMIQYVKLCQQGDSTLKQRLQLLLEQKKKLMDQRNQIDITLDKVDYKIDLYEGLIKKQKK